MKKVVWLTGLSGAGKTTIAKKVVELGFNAIELDGDIVRAGLCKDLGFTQEDRKENIRRIAELSKIFCSNDMNCICSFISPTEEIRELAKNIIGKDNFIEVYINTPIKICELRDTKGLYKKAKSGLIKHFTGIDSIYEPPKNPNFILDCYNYSPNESAKKLFEYLKYLD